MKRIKTILASGLVLALTGLTTLVVAAGNQHAGKAIVRSIKGMAQYKIEGGDWMKLRTNQELPQGSEIKTDKDAEVYLQVNGFTSTVKVTPGTDIKLDKMLQGGGMTSDTSTDVKLDGGNVLGSVRKLSANSDYSVSVPNGVAGIRGTDFSVTVTVNPDGNLTVVFTSVTGTIVCTVNPIVAGQAPPTQTLQSGQSWTVTGTAAGGTVSVTVPVDLPPQVLNAIVVSINNAVTVVTISIQTSQPPPATTTLPPPFVPPTIPVSGI